MKKSFVERPSGIVILTICTIVIVVYYIMVIGKWGLFDEKYTHENETRKELVTMDTTKVSATFEDIWEDVLNPELIKPIGEN